MSFKAKSPAAITAELGERLKQARLNNNLTQAEVAETVGVSRKTVVNAEQGQAKLEVFVAIMVGLNLTEQLDLFLPKPQTSPLQLIKLQGKKRQRASGQRKNEQGDVPQW
jgi:putative transcriptional regulator